MQNPYMLSKEVVPIRYSIELTPSSNNASFTGNEKIELNILKDVNEIKLNVKEVKIEVKSESNLTEEEQIILDNLISDINKTRNNVEIEIEIEESEVKKEIKGNLSDGQQLLVDTLISILANRNEDVKIMIKRINDI